MSFSGWYTLGVIFIYLNKFQIYKLHDITVSPKKRFQYRLRSPGTIKKIENFTNFFEKKLYFNLSIHG